MKGISPVIQLLAGLSIKRQRKGPQTFTDRSAFDEAINRALLSSHEISASGMPSQASQGDSGPVSMDTVFGTLYGTDGSGGSRNIVWLRKTFTFATPINAFAVEIEETGSQQGDRQFVVTAGDDDDVISAPLASRALVAGVKSFIGLFTQQRSFTKVTVSNIDGGDFVRFGSLRFGLAPATARVKAQNIVTARSPVEYRPAVGAN